MARQARVRQPNPHSNQNEGAPCSYEEMYQFVQQEKSEHSAESADAWWKIRAQEDEFHRISKEKGANAR